MNTANLRQVIAWTLGSVVVLGLMACGLTRAQRNAVSQFSRSSAALATAIEDELVRMREATIEMNMNRLAVTGIEAKLPGPDNLDENLDADDVTTRIRAAEALRSYGRLLLALVEETGGKELKEAADDFAGSVRNLASGYRKLSDKEVEAIAELTEAVGRWIVEIKKARAVKRIVLNSSEQVEHLCDLFARDFDVKHGGVASQFLLTTEETIPRLHEAFRSATDPPRRDRLLQMYRTASANRDRRDAVIGRVHEAAENMKKANTELGRVLREKKIAVQDIKEFGNSVKTLVDTLKVLKQELQ